MSIGTGREGAKGYLVQRKREKIYRLAEGRTIASGDTVALY